MNVFVKDFFRFFVMITGAFSVFWGLSHGAFAQKMLEQFSKTMPEFEVWQEDAFLKSSDRLVVDSFDDPALNFEMRVPKGWTNVTKGGFDNISIKNKIMAEITHFYGPPDLSSARSYLNVEAMSMDYYMTVEQWLMQYLLVNSYNLQGFTVHDDKHAEALYVFIKDNISYAARAVAWENGKNILYVQYVVPIERWHDEKIMQKMVLDSFKSTTPIKEYVEEMKNYMFLDLAEFIYPASWEIRAMPIRTIDRMNILLFRGQRIDDGRRRGKIILDGQIDVNLVSIYASETLEDEINYFKNDLAEKGLIMRDIIESRDDFLLGDRFDFVDTQVYKAADQGAKVIQYELWLTVMASGEYYYFISLFTPSRDEDYFKWARNVETYKLVVNEMKPLE